MVARVVAPRRRPRLSSILVQTLLRPPPPPPCLDRTALPKQTHNPLTSDPLVIQHSSRSPQSESARVFTSRRNCTLSGGACGLLSQAHKVNLTQERQRDGGFGRPNVRGACAVQPVTDWRTLLYSLTEHTLLTAQAMSLCINDC